MHSTIYADRVLAAVREEVVLLNMTAIFAEVVMLRQYLAEVR